MIGRVTRRLVCKDISTHCEDLGNDAQLHVTDNWLDTRNENGEKSLILLQICLRLCRVQFRGERIASRPNSAVTWAWWADESSSGDIILSCERDSFKSFSIISDLRDGGLDLVNVDLKDYFSVPAAKAEPSQASLAQIKSWANRFAKIMFSSLTFTE